MTQHTPGPWTADPYAISGGGMEPRHFVDLGDDEPAIEVWSAADARLIAAAPDLLTALIQMVQVFEMHPNHYDYDETQRFLQCQRAIAKATGEEVSA